MGRLKVKPEDKILEGRPTVITPEVLQKLEMCFATAFTDEEACLYCDISPRAFYSYCAENQDFAQKKEILKKKPNMTAKLNIVKALNQGDKDDSKWWLNKKDPEFSDKLKSDNTNKTSLTIDNMEEIRKLSNEALSSSLSDLLK